MPRHAMMRCHFMWSLRSRDARSGYGIYIWFEAYKSCMHTNSTTVQTCEDILYTRIAHLKAIHPVAFSQWSWRSDMVEPDRRTDERKGSSCIVNSTAIGLQQQVLSANSITSTCCAFTTTTSRWRPPAGADCNFAAPKSHEMPDAPLSITRILPPCLHCRPFAPSSLRHWLL